MASLEGVVLHGDQIELDVSKARVTRCLVASSE
jgi:hypothetical protein